MLENCPEAQVKLCWGAEYAIVVNPCMLVVKNIRYGNILQTDSHHNVDARSGLCAEKPLHTPHAIGSAERS